MSTIIQFRRGTAAEWTAANPTLAEGEKGYETDSIGTEEALSKIGDGVNDWVNLPYQVSGKVKSVNGKEGDVVLDGTEIPLLPGTTTPTVTEAIADLSTDVDTKVQSVTGDGVGGTATNPILTFPTPAEINLGNVDNTSDANKPISTATQIALDLKGDQTEVDLNTAKVSDINHVTIELPNVDNTSDANKPVSTAQQTALDLKANQSDLDLTNTQVLNNATALDLKVAIATNPSKTVKGAIKAFYDATTSTLEISIDGVDIP
jgi:hypothetical protein